MRVFLGLMACGVAMGVQCIQAAVRINEFLADNGGSLLTQTGSVEDWIELHNDGAEAVDLGGWFLTDKAQNLTQWAFPEGTEIAAGGYLIVFADSTGEPLVDGELHASFSLSKDGEYLALVQPDGVTVASEFAPQFPAQLKDVSYGVAPREVEWVGVGTTARYRVPNAAGNAAWREGAGTLGFAELGGTFKVTYYQFNTGVYDIDTAERLLQNPAYYRTAPVVASPQVINYSMDGNAHQFSPHNAFPSHGSVTDRRDWVAMKAETAIYVPEAGEWTFNVASDDGFRLRITGHGVNFVSEFLSGRGVGDSLATFNFPQAGVYDLALSYYQGEGGAAVMFSVAKGFQTAFSQTVFKLLGDASAGIMHAGAIGTQVETDVGSVMKGVNSRLDAEWFFTATELPAAGDTVRLAVRCADGFEARVNGVAAGSLNMPQSLAWNSAATATRTPEQAMEWVYLDVPASCVLEGDNVLAITALNNSAANGTFFIQPRVTWISAALQPFYFATPTPGAANGKGYTAPTPEIVVSEPRGYKTQAFNVALSGAPLIRYTLDGSVPTESNGFTYTAPIPVSQTTTLRATAPDRASIRQTTSTYTWLFLEDVVRQSANTPAGWPASHQVNNHYMEYGMRQETVNADIERLRDGMTNTIATLSLVTDLANLFNAQSGIYVNPNNDGRTWERPVSVEVIDPVRGAANEFHIDAGLRIRGAYSRSTGNPKHSLRLFFRSEYGEGKLHFPLFDDEGADVFDKVDLRSESNYSWAFENSNQHTFIREVFSRDTQRDMGMPYTRSRYYHLYINGQYWGVFQTQERGDADYAETYLGGDADDWDCIKTSQPGYTTTASDGTIDAFNAFHNIAINQGFSGANADNYWRVRGLNPDGTRNPDYPIYLDQDNLISYILTAYYTGDPDSPISIWGGMVNNMYALYNRVNPDGFKWLRHDAEHSLGSHGGYGVNCDTTHAGENFTQQYQFNPATLHQRLCAHPEYRLRFADLARQYLFDNGPLTPENAKARFQARMNEIDSAIVGEAARWGHGWFNRTTWLNACNGVLNTYLTQRRDILVGQLKANGWYPAIDPPSYSHYNQTLPAGSDLYIFGDSPFYYTLDGSDPRLPDGSLNPAAIPSTFRGVTPNATLIARGATWRYYDAGNLPAANWNAPDYDATAWSAGPGILGFAGSNTTNPIGTQIKRYVNGNNGTQVTTTYFRHTFNLDRVPHGATFTLNLLRDDGAILYLNGAEILRTNMPAGDVTYDTWSSYNVGAPEQVTYALHTLDIGHLLLPGANTLAVEVHQSNNVSTDLYFDLDLTATYIDAYYADLTLDSDLTLRARAFENTQWSALSQTTLALDAPPPDYSVLRVAEVMFAPMETPGVSPTDRDNFAFLKLTNTSGTDLNLQGCSLYGVDYVFGDTTLAAGASLYLAHNAAGFATRYGDPALPVFQWTSGKLNRDGELIQIKDPANTAVVSFTCYDSWFGKAAKNTGRHLVARDTSIPGTDPSWSTEANWLLKNLPADYAFLRPAEIMHAAPGGDDHAFLELINFGSIPLNLKGLHISDAITCTFPALSLSPGARLLLVKKYSAINTLTPIPATTTICQWTSGNLAKGGEIVTLLDADNAPFFSFTYSDKWFNGGARTTGRSLVAVHLNVDIPLWSTQANWRLSSILNGTPGAPETPALSQAGLGDASAFILSADALEEPFIIQYKDNLRDPGWLTCPDSAWQNINGQIHINLDALPESPSRFFRLFVE